MNFNFFKRKKEPRAYTCACCGTEYSEIPLCFGSEYPDYYFSIPPNERRNRISVTDSLCEIDGEHFFHRCRLIIPINDHKEDFHWNVWTTISAENFQKRQLLWSNPHRIHEPPYFGWLQTLIPTYGDTINIKSMAYEQADGMIPLLEIIEDDHALTNDQRNGITLKKALAIVDAVMRAQHGKS
jgi:hypothetical protein